MTPTFVVPPHIVLKLYSFFSSPTAGGGSESAWSAPPAPGDAAEWAGELRLPGGGFCGTRLDGLRLDLSASDGLALTLASAPPQRYKLSLRTSANEGEGKSETTYQAVLDLSGREAGEWVTLRVPWSAFVAVKRQNEDVSAPKLDASAVRSLGLVLSRFEFNGLPNPCFTEGRFSLKVKSIAPFASPRPALVHVSSAGVSFINQRAFIEARFGSARLFHGSYDR